MRFPLGVILGGVVLFMWGYVFWMLLPFAQSIIHPIADANDSAMSTALNLNVKESGVYIAPKMPIEMDEKAKSIWEARHREGPVYMLFYHHDGKEPMGNKDMAIGAGHALGISFIGALILLAASPRSYPNRVMLVFWTAIFASVWADVGNAIWWHFPWNYTLLQMAYRIVGGLLLAIILATFINPDPDMG